MRNISIASILRDDLNIENLLVDERDSDFHLKIASVSNSDRKALIKKLSDCKNELKQKTGRKLHKDEVLELKSSVVKDIEVDAKKVSAGNCIRFNAHLTQNGSIVSVYSFTVTCSEIPYVIVDYKNKLRIRALDIRELEALQRYPADYTLHSMSSEGKVSTLSINKRKDAIGDGVTSTVGRAVIKKLFPKGSRVASFFSGVNGTGLLAKDHINTVAFCELDEERLGVIRYQNKENSETKYLTNIRNVKAADLPPFDYMIATHPCQSFSKAGNKLGFNDDNGDLVNEVFRIISECSPKGFLCENVVGITENIHGTTFQRLRIFSETNNIEIKKQVCKKYELSDEAFEELLEKARKASFKDETFLDQIKKNIEKLGYSFDYEILNSLDFEVPQNRKRVFYWGFKK